MLDWTFKGNTLRANKGEWSEFYALCKLVLDGFVKVLDKDAAEQGEKKYLDSVSKDEVFYIFSDGNVTCKIGEVAKPISRDSILLEKRVSELLLRIKNSKSTFNNETKYSAFPLPLAEQIAHDLHITIKKTRSDQKADLILKFKTNDVGSSPKPHEISIKSWLGANPTLFNASKNSSRLTYEVLGGVSAFDLIMIKSNNGNVQTREAIKKAKDLGCSFKFDSYKKDAMQKNMARIGCEELIPKIVLQYFLREDGDSVTSNSLLKSLGKEHKSFEHNWKTFLEHSMLGLTAGKLYNQENDISDNVLLVDHDGDLNCVIGRGRLQELLYRLAMIDTPSFKRHDYGYFYEKNGKVYIDLNFQVRLKKAKMNDFL